MESYLVSIIIWAASIWILCNTAKDRIYENGWLTDVKCDINAPLAVVCLSAIPVLRVIIAMTIVYMIFKERDE